MRNRLATAAAESGLSISEEVERRVERSFQAEREAAVMASFSPAPSTTLLAKSLVRGLSMLEAGLGPDLYENEGLVQAARETASDIVDHHFGVTDVETLPEEERTAYRLAQRVRETAVDVALLRFDRLPAAIESGPDVGNRLLDAARPAKSSKNS